VFLFLDVDMIFSLVEVVLQWCPWGEHVGCDDGMIDILDQSRAFGGIDHGSSLFPYETLFWPEIVSQRWWLHFFTFPITRLFSGKDFLVLPDSSGC